MRKLVAIICVISWTGFWAFGYLALAADPADGNSTTVAIILAAVAFLVGVFTYMKLCRDCPSDWRRATPSEGV
ncbi:MAG: hypothetical protein R3D63_12975 [Paracoccaceae bacterium]